MILVSAAGCNSLGLPGPWFAGRTPNVESSRESEETQADPRQALQKRQELLLQTAAARWRHGDKLGAERALLRLLESDPQFVEARQMLADVYTVTNRLDDAAEQLQLVLTARPNNAQAHHSLGLVLESMGMEEESLTHLKRAVILEPGIAQIAPEGKSPSGEDGKNEAQEDKTRRVAELLKQIKPQEEMISTIAARPTSVVPQTAPSLGESPAAVVTAGFEEELNHHASRGVQLTFTDDAPASPSYPKTEFAEAIVPQPGPFQGAATPPADTSSGLVIKRLPSPESTSTE